MRQIRRILPKGSLTPEQKASNRHISQRRVFVEHVVRSRRWRCWFRFFRRAISSRNGGAGGCAIAAHLHHNWDQVQLLRAIEDGLAEFEGRSR